MPCHVDFIGVVHLAPLGGEVAVEFWRVPLIGVHVASVDSVDGRCSVKNTVDQPPSTGVATLALRLLDEESHQA